MYALHKISIFPVTLNTLGWVKKAVWRWRRKGKISGKAKGENEEEKLKCLIILRAASPCEYALYLLTISSSLFCDAPYNLWVRETRGLGWAPTWLCGCALLACLWDSGWKIEKKKLINKRWRLVGCIKYFVFREMRPSGLIWLATQVISPSLSEPFISISVKAAYLSANISEIPGGLMAGCVRLIR